MERDKKLSYIIKSVRKNGIDIKLHNDVLLFIDKKQKRILIKYVSLKGIYVHECLQSSVNAVYFVKYDNLQDNVINRIATAVKKQKAFNKKIEEMSQSDSTKNQIKEELNRMFTLIDGTKLKTDEEINHIIAMYEEYKSLIASTELGIIGFLETIENYKKIQTYFNWHDSKIFIHLLKLNYDTERKSN